MLRDKYFKRNNNIVRLLNYFKWLSFETPKIIKFYETKDFANHFRPTVTIKP